MELPLSLDHLQSSDEDSRISFIETYEYATGHNSSADWTLDREGRCSELCGCHR